MNDEPHKISIPTPKLMNLISHTGYLMGLVEAFAQNDPRIDIEGLIEYHEQTMRELINAI